MFIEHEKLVDFIPISNIPAGTYLAVTCPILTLPIVYGGNDPDFPISYHICPIMQSFSSSLPLYSQSDSFQYLFNMLRSQIDHSPLSAGSSEGDIYYDAMSYSYTSNSGLGPKSVKSAADLQQLLPSHSIRTGFHRVASTVSLIRSNLGSKSNPNLLSFGGMQQGFTHSVHHHSSPSLKSSLSSLAHENSKEVAIVNPPARESTRKRLVTMVRTVITALKWLKKPLVRNRIIIGVLFLLLSLFRKK